MMVRRLLLLLLLPALLAARPGASLAATADVAAPPLAPPSRSGYQSALSTITVQYSDEFPPEAKRAFQYAVEIWQVHLATPVPITIFASTGVSISGVLASARPSDEIANFEGAPRRDIRYPSALANHLAGRDLSPNGPEILVFYDPRLPNWYFGIGQTPKDQFNFASVILHEIGHGLGFLGSASMSGGNGRWDYGMPAIYDSFIVNGDGVRLTDTTQFPNPSAALGQQFTSENLFWVGAGGVTANSENRPKLYAPRTWSPGASLYHLNEANYAPGTINSLMTPYSEVGETEFGPGPIARGMLADMGWTIADVPIPSDPSYTCFPQTGKCVGPDFAEYWALHGGLTQQGYPITDAFDEVSPTDGKTYRVQYFERARFEFHPKNDVPYKVLLGQLGREQLQTKYGGSLPPSLTGSPLGDECATFEETGKQVCGAFLAYWQQHGGLAQQGFPLTDLILETNPTDGKQYPTQYFERARFEYHAEHTGTPYTVLLGLLGRERFLLTYPDGTPHPAPAHLSLLPAVGPQGMFVLVTGSGFAPSSGYFLQLIAPEGQVFTTYFQSSQGGSFTTKFSALPRGDYTARVTTVLPAGIVFGSATFSVPGTGEPSPGPRLSVTPVENPRASAARLFAGVGFTPGSLYLLRVRPDNSQRTIPMARLTADKDGVLVVEHYSAGDQPVGTYVFEVLTADGSQVVASTTYQIIPGNP